MSKVKEIQSVSNLNDTAKEYLSYELSVIPTREDKLPALKEWKPYQSERIKPEDLNGLFIGSNVKGIAIICGAVSGGLEVIDVDTKHDTTGSLWEDLRALIEDNLPELYNSLVIAQTRSGGYHIYYRCSSIAANLKLANKINREVLIETRGQGGYVIAPPSPGYTYIQGGPDKIPSITTEERDILFSIAKSFNELAEEKPKVNTVTAPSQRLSGLSPFEDYNQRGDIITLLESHNWKVVNQRGQRVNLLRPGETDSKTSGNFHTGLRTLRVFSSSTQFDPDRAYSPSQVFSLLECNDDKKLTYRRLLELGYGEPFKGERIGPTRVKTKSITVESVNTVNRETSVISTPGEILKIENIETASGEEIEIISPGPEATEEVLAAIELIQETDKRIYVIEGEYVLRGYRYKLNALFAKYSDLQQQNGGLTDREIDSFIEEVVRTSARLQPVDRDIFLKDFLSNDGVQGIGITEESLALTVERLTSARDKEAQAKELNTLLAKVSELQTKGDINKALDLIEAKVKDVKNITAKELLPAFPSFGNLLADIATIPPAYQTGYRSLDKFVGFNPGAITLIGGRPSHGKTTFMFNLFLQMSELYKEETFYFFTYEEPVRNIIVKLLNWQIGTDLRGYFEEVEDLSKPTNYEFIKHYIKSKRTDIREVEEGKRKLGELIDSQRIKVIGENYSVEQLNSLITYLHKKERIGGVFIDYIQRMRTEERTQDKRNEISTISSKVLGIAKETKSFPIILGAQLNRATVDGKIKKPSLENLKETGNLEEDANTVLSVFNESREKAENAEGETFADLREVDLEIKALKNREGEVNKFTTLCFDKWTGKITDRNYQIKPLVDPF